MTCDVMYHTWSKILWNDGLPRLPLIRPKPGITFQRKVYSRPGPLVTQGEGSIKNSISDAILALYDQEEDMECPRCHGRIETSRAQVRCPKCGVDLVRATDDEGRSVLIEL